MKTTIQVIFLILTIFISSITTRAQISPSRAEGQEPAKTHLDAEFKYSSNQVYLGRRDSTALPYFIPNLSYFHKSGLYASASVNYLKNSTESRVDLVTVEAGYDFTKGQYEGKISFTQFFYSSQSTNVASEMNSSIAYENNLDLGLVKSTITGSLDFGSALDFVLALGIAHEFSLVNDQLDITPSFGMNIASLNNYNAYYKNKKFKGVGTGHGNSNSVSGKIINAGAFQIKDYELSMPVSYTLGKCSFNFTPTYAIPVNPAMVEIQATTNGNSSTIIAPENLTNIFYWELGVTYTF
jgi:hypothetical protein